MSTAVEPVKSGEERMIDGEGNALPTAITPMQMLQIAVEQGADMDKLSKLMDLQERWEATEAKKAFVVAMSKFRERCPTISKTRQGHNTKYAGLSETIDAIKALQTECGLSHSWRTTQEGGMTTVTCRVTHIGGHSEETSLTGEPDKTGSKNSIQAIGSTVSYLQRYTLFSILGMASAEQDDDGKAAADDGLSARRHEVYGLLTERFSADGPAIVKWLAAKKLAPVRTATPAQLDAIEKALGTINKEI